MERFATQIAPNDMELCPKCGAYFLCACREAEFEAERDRQRAVFESDQALLQWELRQRDMA